MKAQKTPDIKPYQLPQVSQIARHIREKNTLPVYYLMGDDVYELNKYTNLLIDYFKPLISDPLNYQSIFYNPSALDSVLDFISSYSFIPEQKLLVLRNFNEMKQSKEINSKMAVIQQYILSPSPDVTLVFIYEGKPQNLTALQKEFYHAGFAFGALQPREQDMPEWIMNLAASKGKRISRDNSVYLYGLTGADKMMIERQVDKIINYAPDAETITEEFIRQFVADTRDFTVFDLQDTIARGDLNASTRIALKLVNSGESLVGIVAVLNSYFTKVAAVKENLHLSDQELSSVTKIRFFIQKFRTAAEQISYRRLSQIFEALYKCDYLAKSNPADEKTLLMICIREMIL